MIDELFRSVPAHLSNESGRVFYSGRDAFSNPSQLYLLGLNPGGSPVNQARETVLSHSNRVLHELPAIWSAYSDESWKNRPVGTSGMQPRVRHLLHRLSLDPGLVPSSNVIFVRTPRGRDLKGRKHALEDACWEFHERVINDLKIKVILCFGRDSGEWVQKKLGAYEHVETFVEANHRYPKPWESHSFRNGRGIAVVIATHPSVAAWNTPAADPTHLVGNLLTPSTTLDGRPR